RKRLALVRLILSEPEFLTLAALASAHAYWPEFRGPGSQGHAPDAAPPVQWSPAVRRGIKWQAPIPGTGWSSPIVLDGRIYLTTAVDNGSTGTSLRALCLDAADARVLWDREIFRQPPDAPPIHRKNSHASPTPVIEADHLYVHFGHQGTACLNAADGTPVWATRDHPYAPVHGNGGSPVIEGGLLIYNADAAEAPAVIALDKATGRQKWRFARASTARNKFSFSTPLLIEVAGARQLVTAGSGVVNALDPATGREIWRATYGDGYSVVPRPVFAHGRIYLATGYNKPSVLAIRADGAGDVTATHIVWQADKNAPHNPSMIVVGDELYYLADNGILTCADAHSGKVHYQERATGPASASILHAAGRLYLQDERGLGVILQAGRAFRILHKNDLAERALASHALVDQDLLIRTEKHLWRITR
ncbi:MAG TPA: PQQ-binding-like beta-propeller repeat protein, partial [Prosthecobacter sp.]|nr:PQQ-binding-like beta-propeller repeat protein [Prosthecobacter sp.]